MILRPFATHGGVLFALNLLPWLLVAGEEDPLVVLPLDEGVGGVAVGLHHGEAAHPVVVGLLPDVAHNLKRAFNLTARIGCH